MSARLAPSSRPLPLLFVAFLFLFVFPRPSPPWVINVIIIIIIIVIIIIIIGDSQFLATLWMPCRPGKYTHPDTCMPDNMQ